MRAAGSVPDLLSPQCHVGTEPPPLPPARPEFPSSENVDGATQPPGFYDTPGGGVGGDAFYNTPPAKYPPPRQSDSAAEFYNVPPTTSRPAVKDNVDGGAFYNTPPAKYPPPHRTDAAAAAEFYSVPPTSHPAETDNTAGSACYDVPPTVAVEKQTGRRATKKKPTKVEVSETASAGGDVYNVPPPLHTQGDNSGSPYAGEFYENVSASGGGKKSKKVPDATGRSGWSSDNRKPSSVQTASVCLADQTYDIPSAEQQGSIRQSASTADETYDTPTRNERFRDKTKQQPPKQSVDVRPSTGISEQTYDTPPTTSAPSSVKTCPDKPVRGKPGWTSVEASLEAVQNSGQETYDIPPTTQQPPPPKPSSLVARNQRQTAAPTDDMYDIPPPKSVPPGNPFDRRATDAANMGGFNQPEEQTYNVPASCVPPVPAKRHQAPPPKPPRPTGPLSAHSLVSATDASVSSSTPEKVGTIDESEVSEKDTVPELLSAGTKGNLALQL